MAFGTSHSLSHSQYLELKWAAAMPIRYNSLGP